MTTPENLPSESFQVRLVWRNADMPSQPINQFIVSMGLPGPGGDPDAVHIALGQADPPLITGTPEQMRQQAQELGTLPVDTKGRYVLSRTRLGELIQVLQQAANTYDNMRQPGGLTGGDADAYTA
ncbi:hypothetical protein ACH414_13550 [Streptomyces sp. NPDC020422]|uniref:hypothetical protein n=1 Tax=Streptomyces sp. NPDC020422 TaxID=3365074 RepID=UPI00379BF051